MKSALNQAKKCLFLLILFSLSFFTFAKDDTNKLRVGFLSDMPYLMYKNPDNGHMEGYGYDYLQMIANFTNWEYEYVFGEWYVLWNMFLDGEIDILEDVSYVPEREEKMLFPNVPMGKEIYRLYVYDNNSEINAENLGHSLSKKKIGVTAETIQYELFNEWVKRRNIDCQVIPFNSDFFRNEELKKGNIDAVVELEASSLHEWEPIIEIGSTDYYMALSKGNEKHLEELNRALISIESIIPDFNNSLFYNYYARTIVSKRLSDSEKEWINKHKVLRCGYIDDLISNTPQNPGIFSEIMNEIKRVTAIDSVELKFIYFEDYDKLLSALQKDEIDVAYPLSAFPGNAEIENYSIFVNNVSNLAISTITKKDTSYEDIKTVGIPKKGGGFYHAKNAYPKAEIIRYENSTDIFDEILKGNIQAGLLPSRLIQSNLLAKQKYSVLKAVQLQQQYETGIAVKRGNTSLFQILRRGISLLDTRFINDTIAKNTIIQADYSFKTFISNHVFFFVFVMIVFFGIICLMIIMIYKRKIVQQNYLAEKHLRNQLANALKQTEEHQKKERELLYLSETDKLTGISNRGAEGKIKQFIDIGTPGLFLLFDVDKFKTINDSYGHLVGDKVLIAIAKAMKKVFRESDIILRLGGDEFAVYAIGITEKDAAISLLKRFFAEINSVIIPELENIRISISLGATFFDIDKKLDYETIYRQADKGCYISKKESGNFYTFIE